MHPRFTLARALALGALCLGAAATYVLTRPSGPREG